MIKLERRSARLGEDVIPYEQAYPNLPWINLLATTRTIEPYTPLAPTTSNHPLSSIIGVTYFSFGAVVMANLLHNVTDRIDVASTLGHVNIRNLPFKVDGRQSPRTLVYLLLFERYIMDMPFRKVIKRAARLNIHFDAYSHELQDRPTTLYYTNWYPELVNRIVEMEKTGNINHFLSRTKLDTKWYEDFIYCSNNEFCDGYTQLIERFSELRDSPIVSKYICEDNFARLPLSC